MSSPDNSGEFIIGESEETALRRTYSKIQAERLSGYKKGLMTDGGSLINRQNPSGWWGDLPEERRIINGRGIAEVKAMLEKIHGSKK